ncbi:putative signal transducing protein [Halanaerobium saccharolyticum]|uniref:Putative signal transducing protein n=1 Tax=Halanaerobium saccharolyticum TaxID=43595 RepID=A0A4R6LUD4_9FIRM|nr:DUF2007 domain-containing protein [Halanaerobium saccharolyticum]TDO92027.1 putative signal transducing protein [Halanaerobium saccharolyticum]
MADFRLKHLITTGVREAEMIESLLKDNNIEVIVRHDEFGDYSMLYMGFSAFNIELYVAEEDYAQAQDLVSSLNIKAEQKEDESNRTENDQNEKSFSHYLALTAKIIIIIYLLFNLAALIF